ncbi:MAG: class I SAM-dependent methyltransferase [Proteobacteria bacterium]|nr:class I SAM-dependent methyltransferase [Pseudomonadota bacterium]
MSKLSKKISTCSENTDLCLQKEEGILKLVNIAEKSSVFVDFCSKKSIKRINEQGLSKQDLIKAVGLNKKKDLSILDCTAGLGKDSFILASITQKSVMMLERNPTSFALLEDGLKRLNEQTENKQLSQICSRLELKNIDAIEFLKNTEEKFDVIYIDPMFIFKKSKAKVKKEMAFFHETVGDDSDSDILLELALQKANKRVVVKRHKSSPFLAEQEPNVQFKGKSNRFDVYLV